MISLQNQNPARIGIDLGGSKIEILVLDRTGSELFRKRVPTPQGDYHATLRALFDLVTAAQAATPALTAETPVGMGIPGTLSPATGRVKNANSTCLIGHPLDRDLEALLKRPVRLANDADCFALSEATDGAGADAATVFGVILGTGVGGGIVVHGRLLGGPNAIAGEWGHNPLPWAEAALDEIPGAPCYCGLNGCLETFLSGPGLERDYALQSAGERRTAIEIASAARDGHPMALAVMDRYHRRLARALAHVINILDPGVIVLGGGLSHIPSLYEQVSPLLADYVFSDRVDTPIVPPRHGDASGVRGAAWLWP